MRVHEWVVQVALFEFIVPWEERSIVVKGFDYERAVNNIISTKWSGITQRDRSKGRLGL